MTWYKSWKWIISCILRCPNVQCFIFSTIIVASTFIHGSVQISSVFTMKYMFFFHCDYSFHDLSHLLQTLFLQPLHSTHDRHPLQRTFSHSPTYDLRSSCLFLSYFNCMLLSLCRALWRILRAKMENLAG